MAVTRWNPWGELFSLTETMDQLFGRTFMPERGGVQAAHLPLDIRQAEEAFVIEASLPGFTPEQVDVTLDEGVLTIRARHEQDADEGRGGGYVRRERRVTSLFRQVGLPAEVREDGITATFENGVLTVTVPRAQRAQPRRISVNAGQQAQPTIVEGKAEAPAATESAS